MKHYKRICAAVFSLMLCTANAFAEGNFGFYENILPNGNTILVVDGYSKAVSQGEEINILVLNPGYDLENAGEITDGGYIKFADSVLTDSKGYFKAEIPMNVITDMSGSYKCYVGGKAFSDISENGELYFANEDSRKGAVELLKGSSSVDDMYSKLSENKDNLSINNELVNGIDLKKLAEDLYKDKNILDSEKYMDTIRAIRQKALIIAYNDGKKDLVQKDNRFLHTDLIDFSSVDKNGVTIYSEGYEKILSESGKGKLVDALCGKNFARESDLLKVFSEQVIMLGIKNAVTEGSGHVDKLITRQNADLAGLNVPSYFAITSSAVKTAVNNSVVNGSFNTIGELKKVIDDAVSAANSKAPQQGGGNGGGTTSGSSSKNTGSYNVVLGNNDLNQDSSELNQVVEIFTDLENAQWAKEAIINLYQREIINGVGENKFAPSDNVTREQFIVMIMRAFNIEANAEENYFEDAVSGAYYEKYVNTAKKLGIVNGIDDKNFGVGRSLSRQDLAVMVKNIAEKNSMNINGEASVEFADGNEISDYAKEAVDTLTKAKIINGFTDNTFRPKESCTRAQAAKIIYELMRGENK